MSKVNHNVSTSSRSCLSSSPSPRLLSMHRTPQDSASNRVRWNRRSAAIIPTRVTCSSQPGYQVLNFDVGAATLIDGRTCLMTRLNAAAHALYGPYQLLEPGHYVVGFEIMLPTGQSIHDDQVCGIVDIAADYGRTVIAHAEVRPPQLRVGRLPVTLTFDVQAAGRFEYRFFTNGVAELVVADAPVVLKLQPGDDPEAKIALARFPDVTMPRPAFFRDHVQVMRQLHSQGAHVEIRGDDTVVTIEGISFYARIADDLRFVDEIFFRRAYNILLEHDACVIDIGMNLGLVSMQFASRPTVREVHSFEPFRATYDRAIENLTLNPSLSAKITPHNFGLADRDEDRSVLVGSHGDSGMNSIDGSHEGTPTRISVRNAATCLAPIVARAREQGRRVVAKVDCEGAEFAIFDALTKAGLIGQFSALMVEWHRAFEMKTQHDLIAPLLREGFIVFDLSVGNGNGFFYAVRAE